MAAWVISELVAIVFLGLSKDLSLYHVGGKVYFSDFVRFYMAGKMTMSPVRQFFYSWDVQKTFLQSILQEPLPVEDLYSPYLPIVFLMMAPYSWLSINHAHLLFDVVNLCIGLAGCFMIIRSLNKTDNTMNGLVLLGTLASLPCAITWLIGQISWLYVGFICFYLAFMRNKKDIPASLALFFTIIKPQYAVFLLIPAIYLKRYRLLLYALGWGILFLVLCTYVFGLKAMIAYPLVLNQSEVSLQSVHAQAMYCFRPLLELFLSKPMAYYGCLALWVSAFLFLLFIAMGNSNVKDKESTFAWLVSITLITSILFSPHAHSHDVMLLVIPALFTLPGQDAESKQIYMKVWRAIFYSLPVVSWLCYLLVCIHIPGNLIVLALIATLFICGIMRFLDFGVSLRKT